MRARTSNDGHQGTPPCPDRLDCPYCANEISGTDLDCGRCGRDLSLFLPLFARIRTLEADVATARKGVPQLVLLVISTAVVLLTSCGSLLSYWHFKHSELWLFLILSLGFPAFAGLALGRYVRGRRVWLYARVGWAIGLIDWLGVGVIYSGRNYFRGDLLFGLGAYFLGAPLLVVLSGSLASWRGRRLPEEANSSDVAKSEV